jgi:hypothetical protein
VVTGDYLDITQAEALETLLGWERAAQAEDGEPAGRFEAGTIEVVRPRVMSFHPKSWRFESRYGVGTSDDDRERVVRHQLHLGRGTIWIVASLDAISIRRPARLERDVE